LGVRAWRKRRWVVLFEDPILGVFLLCWFLRAPGPGDGLRSWLGLGRGRAGSFCLRRPLSLALIQPSVLPVRFVVFRRPVARSFGSGEWHYQNTFKTVSNHESAPFAWAAGPWEEGEGPRGPSLPFFPLAPKLSQGQEPSLSEKSNSESEGSRPWKSQGVKGKNKEPWLEKPR